MPGCDPCLEKLQEFHRTWWDTLPAPDQVVRVVGVPTLKAFRDLKIAWGRYQALLAEDAVSHTIEDHDTATKPRITEPRTVEDLSEKLLQRRRARLNQNDLDGIRAMLEAGFTQVETAARFNVTPGYVSKLKVYTFGMGRDARGGHNHERVRP